jgi:succinate dehydrogenase / fumarate reductase cytochrome b subunit
MGITGLLLVTFLIVHAGINALIFVNDGGHLFESAAEFMGTNWIIRTAEVGLMLGLLAHILDGLMLWADNRKARPVGYALSNASANSKWYSRSMGLLGMKEVFVNPMVVVVYVLGCLSLSYHLMHGVSSAFQSMGWNHKKYTPAIKTFGYVYSIIIPLLFAAMPIAMHFGWIK